MTSTSVTGTDGLIHNLAYALGQIQAEVAMALGHIQYMNLRDDERRRIVGTLRKIDKLVEGATKPSTAVPAGVEGHPISGRRS